jgi:HlyD family secretion protein
MAAMKKKRSILIPVLLIVVLAAGAAWFTMLRGDSTELEFYFGEAGVGTVQNTVAATGNLEPLSNVQVGSQVSGQIQTLYADFNTQVTRGQMLAKIDPRPLQTQLENTRANLASARSRIRTSEADLENAHANVGSSEAALATSRAEYRRAQSNHERAVELFEADLAPMTQVEDAEVNLQSAEARLVAAEASLQQAQAQIIAREAGLEQAHAAVTQAEAALEEAEVNLEYTDIRSPVDGVVISREVDVGQTVSASTSAPTLFQIAEDLSRMRVVASVDEADIGLLEANAPVEFMVDAYPERRFNGQIEQIRLNPQTSQNVVTYQVIVGVTNPEQLLKPGMTANLTVTLERRDEVLTVPNSALRYNPPEDYLARLMAEADPTAAAEGGTGAEAESGDERPESMGEESGRGFDPTRFDPANLPEGAREFARDGFAGRGSRGAGNAAASSTQPSQARQPIQGQLWVMSREGIPEPRTLMLGLSDGTRTEVVSGDLLAGEPVIIGDSSQLSEEGDGGVNNNDVGRMMRMMRGGGGGWR